MDRYPEVDSLVMVQVKQIQENGAYVKLVNYCRQSIEQ
jgi:translation initiation factor 2 alpha subunit (eIF-2alpha)